MTTANHVVPFSSLIRDMKDAVSNIGLCSVKRRSASENDCHFDEGRKEASDRRTKGKLKLKAVERETIGELLELCVSGMTKLPRPNQFMALRFVREHGSAARAHKGYAQCLEWRKRERVDELLGSSDSAHHALLRQSFVVRNLDGLDHEGARFQLYHILGMDPWSAAQVASVPSPTQSPPARSPQAGLCSSCGWAVPIWGT